jgi:hypothetical protein
MYHQKQALLSRSGEAGLAERTYGPVVCYYKHTKIIYMFKTPSIEANLCPSSIASINTSDYVGIG